MRAVSIANPSLVSPYKTYLASAYTSGVSLTVLSNVSFSGNDLIVVGEPGEELTELQTISNISGKTTITLKAALNFAHIKDTPIYKHNWNFVEIEGRSTSSGIFALITQSPIQWDKLNTVYYHAAGTNTWEYRHRFYNSVTATYSEYGPTVTGLGFTRSQVGYMIRQVRQITNDLDGRIAGDRAIIRFFNAAQDIIRGVKTNWWFLRVTDTSTTTTVNINKYALPTNVSNTGNVEDVRYQFNDGTINLIYQLKFYSEREFDLLVEDQNRSTDDYAKIYTFKEADSSSASGYLLVEPIPKTTGRGTFHIRYNREMADLDTVDDETLVPLPVLLENFAIAQMERIKGNEAKAQIYADLFYGRQQVGRRIISSDMGINLLIKLDNAKKRPAGQPFSLVRYRGVDRENKFYNNRFVDRDYLVETYF